MQPVNELFTVADQYYQHKQYELAHDTYRRALACDPNNKAGQFNFGMLKLRLGDIKGDSVVKKVLVPTPDPNVLDLTQAIQAVIEQLLYMGYKTHAAWWLKHARENKVELSNMQRLSRKIDLPAYLDPVRKNHVTGQQWLRYSPFESDRYVYAIETVSGCNLRCPTCPVSQQGNQKNGLMSVDVFSKIIEKIKLDKKILNPDIWLFNWSEPLLHPQISEFVKITTEVGLTSLISTNLNVAGQLPSLMKSEPTRLKVSLSSFNQEIYGRTHARGLISRVLKNLEMLARLRDAQKNKTHIWVGHHLYKDTLSEVDSIRKHVEMLGFEYHSSYAIMAPIETVLDLIKDPKQATRHQILEHLVFDPVSSAKENNQRRSGQFDCEMRFNMTTINFDGSVMLCCGTTKPLSNRVRTDFLQTPRQRIEDLKYDNPFCASCIGYGLSLTAPDV